MGIARKCALALAMISVGCGGGGSTEERAAPAERVTSAEGAGVSAGDETTEIGAATDLEAPSEGDSAATETEPGPESEPEPEPAAVVPSAQRLPAPPLTFTPGSAAAAAQRARLVRVSSRQNAITDVDAWRTANQLPQRTFFGSDLSQTTPSVERFPEAIHGQRLRRLTPSGDLTVLTYGASLVAIADAEGTLTRVFDFSAWSAPYPRPVGTSTDMDSGFAQVDDGVLYIAHYHRTFASRSHGKNAYLSAVDVATGRLLWRSAPLTQNARTFVLGERVLIAGYGFTNEKDYLYVVDRNTGRMLARDRLEAGPRFLVERGGDIFIRAYDRDYVYRVRVTP